MTQTRNESPDARAAEPIVVSVKPATYQPSKAELEADIRVDATPAELRSALTRTVRIKTEA